MSDQVDMLLGSAATFAVAGIVQMFRNRKDSAIRFAIVTAVVLIVALIVHFATRANP
jgi:diacylglycerol kinase